ncbi:OmpH family outer membrane protein [Desulfovibrio litoralis]|uniref:Periplasmic chaperone for outer membrane proteins Skp n=1 Tax=Desulfovibrio litoralis DSM 11393 TaxID=1121455 RepID=A0A1M7SND5_9BACT|nr:OmpH family outer membrane protein [Desulfovibrio litoralis]SHN59938.1 periplasmic chaperone for outer membrane proteins Skp [Desulfovibrio litoralis DSM 11393]
MVKCFFLALAGVMLFAAPVFAAELKLGIFNMQYVATQCDAAKAVQKKMQDQFSAEKTAIEKQEAELKRRAEEMQKSGDKMTPEAREDKRTQFIRMKRDYEDKARSFLRRVEQAEMKARQDITLLIVKAVQEIGNAKSYTVIMDGMSAGVLHADKSVDVTQAVLDEANKIYKTSGIPALPSANAKPKK